MPFRILSNSAGLSNGTISLIIPYCRSVFTGLTEAVKSSNNPAISKKLTSYVKYESQSTQALKCPSTQASKLDCDSSQDRSGVVERLVRKAWCFILKYRWRNLVEESNVFNTTSLICPLEFQPKTDEAFTVDGCKHTHTRIQALHFGDQLYSKNVRILRFHEFLHFCARKHMISSFYTKWTELIKKFWILF